MSELRRCGRTTVLSATYVLFVFGLAACSGGGGGGATEPDLDNDPPPPDPPMTVVAPTATVLKAEDLGNLGDSPGTTTR